MYRTWLRLLPGFTWLSWGSFLLGVVESFAYGWYVALVFGSLFNFFAVKFENRKRSERSYVCHKAGIIGSQRPRKDSRTAIRMPGSRLCCRAKLLDPSLQHGNSGCVCCQRETGEAAFV